MAANKVRGVRAALCPTSTPPAWPGPHNDANVLGLGGRILGDGLALAILDLFLATPFEGGRHARRGGPDRRDRRRERDAGRPSGLRRLRHVSGGGPLPSGHPAAVPQGPNPTAGPGTGRKRPERHPQAGGDERRRHPRSGRPTGRSGPRPGGWQIPMAAKNPPANTAAASGTSRNTRTKAIGPTAPPFYRAIRASCPLRPGGTRTAAPSRVACPVSDRPLDPTSPFLPLRPADGRRRRGVLPGGGGLLGRQEERRRPPPRPSVVAWRRPWLPAPTR